VKLTRLDVQELAFLAKQRSLIWGGHLQRGQPLNDQHMVSWLANGLIERVGNEGYRITPAGRAALEQSKEK
jgi:hypothetical protein